MVGEVGGVMRDTGAIPRERHPMDEGLVGDPLMEIVEAEMVITMPPQNLTVTVGRAASGDMCQRSVTNLVAYVVLRITKGGFVPGTRRMERAMWPWVLLKMIMITLLDVPT